MMNPKNHVYDRLAQRAKLIAMYNASGCYHMMKFIIQTKPLQKKKG